MEQISQRGQRLTFDILVIGGGIAGLSFILEIIKLQPKVRIALLMKQDFLHSNSNYAQGGIACVAKQQDSFIQHIEDTLAAGDHFCYSPAVESIIQHAPEGGHSQHRIHHFQDTTGAEIIRALAHAVSNLEQVTIFDYHTAVNLITDESAQLPGKYPTVFGAYVLDEKKTLIHTFLANTVVLATGGAGKVYRYTSNSDLATGDGIAMTYRAGARVTNMEFYQFHPTLLHHPSENNFLLSEALRGEGAYLRLPRTGERFMQRYAPEKMELATRDIVARAIFTEIESSEYNYVYLDMRHRDKHVITQRFPNIYHKLLSLGIDITKDLVPVVPAAHYLCGGIITNVSGNTDLDRLYAIGETASTGLHGANRLASNSLLEGVVMAQQAARDCQHWLSQAIEIPDSIPDWDSRSVIDIRRASQINAHWRSLRGEMMSYAGIIRTRAGLIDLLQLTQARREMIEAYYWQHVITRDLVELRNIALVAELIIRAALKRCESRGVHYRADYPEKAQQIKRYYQQQTETDDVNF